MGLSRHFALAFAVALTALPGIATNSITTTADGEFRFRTGDFEGARRAFTAAAEADPSNARAWWGLGRVDQISFHPADAQTHFTQAYRLNPRDPEFILSYLEYVKNPDARVTLLRNVIALSRESMPRRAEQAMAKLEIEAALSGRTPNALASPLTNYRLPLTPFLPAGPAQHGFLVTARVNGSRPLKLLLDTGARGLVLHAKAARTLALQPVTNSLIGGIGRDLPAVSTLYLARTVTFGELEFHDCPTAVTDQNLVPGADGVLSPALLERFRLRIDPDARSLYLTPGPETVVPAGPHVVSLDRLLLVRANMSFGREGWFLLDTGAAFTSISPALAPPAHAGLGQIAMSGAQGQADVFRLPALSLQVSGRQLADRQAVSLDLRAMSQREGVEISGILGYSALGRWPVIIDLRSGLVQIGDSQNSR